MKKILTFVLFAVLGVSVAFGQPGGGQKDNPPQTGQTDARAIEQQIIEIENQWSQAFLKRDPAFFERHVADDYVGIYPTRRITKADLIAGAKGGGDRTFVSAEAHAPKVRVYEKTAVVTGHGMYRMREKSGEAVVVRTLYTEVFVLRDGRWQCVAGHYTPLASPE